MLKVREDDKTAFAALFRKHGPAMLRYCGGYVGNAQLAEDLTQDVFVKVWGARRDYRPRARFTTWLYTIASNVCRNELRRRGRQRRLFGIRLGHEDGVGELSHLPAEVVSPEDAVRGGEIGHALERGLTLLPERQRQALLLSRVAGLPAQRIAEIMHRSERAVRVLICRATSALKRECQRLLGTETRRGMP
jgi:RNA polymerase sigma-70 factor (ECF subfamily)